MIETTYYLRDFEAGIAVVPLTLCTVFGHQIVKISLISHDYVTSVDHTTSAFLTIIKPLALEPDQELDILTNSLP